MSDIAFLKSQISDYDEILKEVETIDRARAVASASIYGLKFFEIRLERPFPNETGHRYAGSVNVALSTLKDLGICSRMNSFKKVNEWLKGEGLEYVKQRQLDKYKERQLDYVKRLEKAVSGS